MIFLASVGGAVAPPFADFFCCPVRGQCRYSLHIIGDGRPHAAEAFAEFLELLSVVCTAFPHVVVGAASHRRNEAVDRGALRIELVVYRVDLLVGLVLLDRVLQNVRPGDEVDARHHDDVGRDADDLRYLVDEIPHVLEHRAVVAGQSAFGGGGASTVAGRLPSSRAAAS